MPTVERMMADLLSASVPEVLRMLGSAAPKEKILGVRNIFIYRMYADMLPHVHTVLPVAMDALISGCVPGASTKKQKDANAAAVVIDNMFSLSTQDQQLAQVIRDGILDELLALAAAGKDHVAYGTPLLLATVSALKVLSHCDAAAWAAQSSVVGGGAPQPADGASAWEPSSHATVSDGGVSGGASDGGAGVHHVQRAMQTLRQLQAFVTSAAHPIVRYMPESQPAKGTTAPGRARSNKGSRAGAAATPQTWHNGDELALVTGIASVAQTCFAVVEAAGAPHQETLRDAAQLLVSERGWPNGTSDCSPVAGGGQGVPLIVDWLLYVITFECQQQSQQPQQSPPPATALDPCLVRMLAHLAHALEVCDSAAPAAAAPALHDAGNGGSGSGSGASAAPAPIQIQQSDTLRLGPAEQAVDAAAPVPAPVQHEHGAAAAAPTQQTVQEVPTVALDLEKVFAEAPEMAHVARLVVSEGGFGAGDASGCWAYRYAWFTCSQAASDVLTPLLSPAIVRALGEHLDGGGTATTAGLYDGSGTTVAVRQPFIELVNRACLSPHPPLILSDEALPSGMLKAGLVGVMTRAAWHQDSSKAMPLLNAALQLAGTRPSFARAVALDHIIKQRTAAAAEAAAPAAAACSQDAETINSTTTTTTTTTTNGRSDSQQSRSLYDAFKELSQQGSALRALMAERAQHNSCLNYALEAAALVAQLVTMDIVALLRPKAPPPAAGAAGAGVSCGSTQRQQQPLRSDQTDGTGTSASASSTRHRACAVCGAGRRADGSKLQRCGWCDGGDAPRYCSLDCQRKHWKEGHKGECKGGHAATAAAAGAAAATNQDD